MDSFGDKWDEECSTIGDKGEISFIDYGNDKSVYSYNTIEEGPIVISAPFAFVGGKPQSVTVGENAAVLDAILWCSSWKQGLPKHFCDAHLPKHDTKIVLEDEGGEEFETKYLWDQVLDGEGFL